MGTGIGMQTLSDQCLHVSRFKLKGETYKKSIAWEEKRSRRHLKG